MFFHGLFWRIIMFGWIFKLLIIGLVIWLVINSIGRSGHNKDLKINPESALDILKIRYAKGEITKEQFEQMRKDLG